LFYQTETQTKHLKHKIMTALSRTNETLLKIAILASILLGMAVSSSVKAQSANHTRHASVANNEDAGVNDAPVSIRLASDVNIEARPSQLQNFINSPYDDIKPKLSPSGKRLYFSRNFHPGNVDGVNDPEDIWYSEHDENLNTWSEPIHLTGLLNNAGPNYVNNISTSGDTLILGNQYLKKGRMRAGLSYSVNVNGTWSVPKAIDIVNDYNMSAYANAFVSLKNGVIIQSVQRAESIGERDLVVSFWNGENATEPISMGAVINSEREESSPFLAADNKTLYFASKGHGGYGGYDIYVTRRLDDTWTNWSVPENLGPAVNGSLDDEFFSITNCGNVAVFSKQVNVHNNDLFRISMNDLFGGSDDNNPVASKKESSFAGL
jgi:OmpA-OmpF porin, OOP family